jgi:hypothetical protein
LDAASAFVTTFESKILLFFLRRGVALIRAISKVNFPLFVAGLTLLLLWGLILVTAIALTIARAVLTTLILLSYPLIFSNLLFVLIRHTLGGQRQFFLVLVQQLT